MAALQALRNPWPQDNVKLLTSIHHLATNLSERGTRTTITWIPGHAGIHGNGLADEAAKAATTLQDQEVTVSPSMAQVKRIIRANTLQLHKSTHEEEAARGSPSATWYARATEYKPAALLPNTHPKVRAGIHRLHLGYHCLSSLQGQLPLPCQYCESQTYKPLLHYLLQCPATTNLRGNHQYPEPEDDDAEEAAALIIATTSVSKLTYVVEVAPPP